MHGWTGNTAIWMTVKLAPKTRLAARRHGLFFIEDLDCSRRLLRRLASLEPYYLMPFRALHRLD